MRAREARAAAALIDAVAAPEPPLPPVERTDAVASFASWVALAPQPNRAVLRATLLALAAARFPLRDRAGRLALLRRLGRSPLGGGPARHRGGQLLRRRRRPADPGPCALTSA